MKFIYNFVLNYIYILYSLLYELSAIEMFCLEDHGNNFVSEIGDHDHSRFQFKLDQHDYYTFIFHRFIPGNKSPTGSAVILVTGADSNSVSLLKFVHIA